MKRSIVWKRAGRVFVLAFIVMVIVALWGIISVARELANIGSGTADFALFGLPMFQGTKDGSLSTLHLRSGVIAVIVVPAVLAAAAAILSARPTATQPRR
jgi:hypothetical protein